MLPRRYHEHLADECKRAAGREGGARVEVTTYQREQCALYKEKLLIENGRDRSDCCKIYQFDFCVGVRWPRVNGWPVQRRECFKYP